MSAPYVFARLTKSAEDGGPVYVRVDLVIAVAPGDPAHNSNAVVYVAAAAPSAHFIANVTETPDEVMVRLGSAYSQAQGVDLTRCPECGSPGLQVVGIADTYPPIEALECSACGARTQRRGRA